MNPAEGRAAVAERRAAPAENRVEAPAERALAAAVRAARDASATAVTVAVLAGGRAEVHCFGRTGRGRAPACTPDTVFELGSVSKTFTALLLAAMAARGELALSEPLRGLLPADWPAPAVRSAEPIRLLHLATHTSGLPRLPPGLLASALPAWNSNPYAAFDEARLRAALAATTVRTEPGRHYRYSNYGVGLLGRALAERAGLPYGALLADRVLAPLGLTATTCAPDPPHRATGHRHGRPLPPWRIPALPAAGAVRSSGADLLRYLGAHLAPPAADAVLAAALADVRHPRLRLPGSADLLALVWTRRHAADRDVYFHSGGTRGCTSFVGFSPATASRAPVAVAALTNTGPSVNGRFVQAGYDLLRAWGGTC
ncbi:MULTISPECIES: serine hydrolase domain-containing protein [Kitasatospora]|uniref:Beta-lactamase n=1 Tax=Kitasatospora setae (strain ATCC 33774 / DSM 43861 / JCM 3304 / KCC A-0304 / NBRC 14216 / KM-6054) TaxID=452652 RepID=E4N644_KITSK|nr:serine hydrolase domain-containing protein [Kitasatospora setae]BAJ26675.1 putative peptidase S12 family protein [Kitasatospora setae KM-6054]